MEECHIGVVPLNLLEGVAGPNVPVLPLPPGAPEMQVVPRAIDADPMIIRRARRYLEKLPPAISGQGGHNKTFRAACVLVKGFGLPIDQAMPLLQEYSQRCQPPWSDRELRHKLEDAEKRPGPIGELLDNDRVDLPRENGNEVDHVQNDNAPADQPGHNLLHNDRRVPRPFEAQRNVIFEIRQKQGGDDVRRDFEINTAVATLIHNDLGERGKMLHDACDTYFFNDGDKKLITLSSEDVELICLLSRYGLNPIETIFRYVVKDLQIRARRDGQKVQAHRFAHYDRASNTLYIYNHANGVYRITEESIELRDNGTDGVLFIHDPKCEPFRVLDESEQAEDPFYETITKKINFRANINLSREQQEALFTFWFYGLFFGSLLPTRPIMAFIGEKGSGKSITLRKVGLLLSGSQFEVKEVPEKEDGFDAVVTSSHFAAFDNADTKVEWLPDKLAICATGGSVSKRQLYTTNTLVDYPINCFLGITSRTPHFRRDDVADRLIVMQLERFEEGKLIAERSLLDEVLQNRDRIMTAVLRELQEILRSLRVTSGRSYTASPRMADFATFVLRIADAKGNREKADALFDTMVNEQAAFTLEGDTLLDLLTLWLKDVKNHGREIDAASLHRELLMLAEIKGVDFTYRNGRALAQRLTHVISNLREFFDVQSRTGSDNKKLYAFRLLSTSAGTAAIDSPIPAIPATIPVTQPPGDWLVAP